MKTLEQKLKQSRLGYSVNSIVLTLLLMKLVKLNLFFSEESQAEAGGNPEF